MLTQEGSNGYEITCKAADVYVPFSGELPKHVKNFV